MCAHSLHGLEGSKFKHPAEYISSQCELVVWLFSLARIETQGVVLHDGLQGVRVELVFVVVHTSPGDLGIRVMASTYK